MLASVSLAVEAAENSKQGAAPSGSAPASAQTGEMSGRVDGRPNKWGYNYPHSSDAEIAAPKVHRVPFEDEHVMLMEVSNPPGYTMQMHGHPYPSVTAMSALLAFSGKGMPLKDTKLDPKSSMNGQNWRGAKPKGAPLPVCMSADPQAPHEPLNVSDVPMHFWRIEFKRIDEDDTAGMKARYAKAPLHKTLHETEDMRFVEITVQPGGKDPGSADALPGVLAFDTVAAFEALSAVEDAAAGRSEAPVGMLAPRCIAAADKVAPEVRNTSDLPLHYYRVEFKRMDGDGLATNWRTWYPQMVEMLKEQGK
jgi:hypothetical protein